MKRKKGLRYFTDLFNKNPYASSFNKLDSQDKAMLERSVAQEWAESLEANFGTVVSTIDQGNDPPDFVMMLGNKTVTVELTELVDERLKGMVASKASSGETINLGSHPIFEDAQWNKKRFDEKICHIIEKKEIQYLKKSLDRIDYLVIHTDEPWLLPSQVKEWTGQNTTSVKLEFFREVHLLMTYCPHQKMWPLFKL